MFSDFAFTLLAGKNVTLTGSYALDIFLVFCFIVLVFVIILIPLLRFLYNRIILYVQCRFMLNNSKYSKGSWLLKPTVFGWAFFPYWLRKKPDFVIVSTGVAYVVKLHSFYDSRKKITFTSPSGWWIVHEKRRRKMGDQLLTIKSQEQRSLNVKTKPAPEYLLKYTHRLSKEINIPCVPMVLICPDIKFIFTKNGVVMSNGDYTFYGTVIANKKYLRTLIKRTETNPLPPLSHEEKSELSEKIRKVMKMKLR